MNKNKQMIKKKANEAMKKKKRYVLVYKIDTVVQKVITVLPVLVFIIYTAILFYLFLFKTDPIIVGLMDFLLAILSALIMAASYFGSKNDEEGILFTIAFAGGTIIAIVVGLQLMDPSFAGRTLTFICLVVTCIQYLIGFLTKRRMRAGMIKEEQEKQLEKMKWYE